MSHPQNSSYTAIEVDSDDSPVGRPKSVTDDKKVQKLKDHVSEVSNIMQENINKILERGQRLDHLEDRSGMLASRADEFRVSSKRVSRKMWWQNMRMNMIIGLVVVSVIVVLIIILRN